MDIYSRCLREFGNIRGNLKISRGRSPREIFKFTRVFPNSRRQREYISIFTRKTRISYIFFSSSPGGSIMRRSPQKREPLSSIQTASNIFQNQQNIFHQQNTIINEQNKLLALMLQGHNQRGEKKIVKATTSIVFIIFLPLQKKLFLDFLLSLSFDISLFRSSNCPLVMCM